MRENSCPFVKLLSFASHLKSYDLFSWKNIQLKLCFRWYEKKIGWQYRTVKSLLLGTIDSILNVSWVALIYWTAQCAHLIFIQQLLCMLHKCIYWDVRIYVSTVWLHFLFLLPRYFTCTLVFDCCELSQWFNNSLHLKIGLLQYFCLQFLQKFCITLNFCLELYLSL